MEPTDEQLVSLMEEHKITHLTVDECRQRFMFAQKLSEMKKKYAEELYEQKIKENIKPEYKVIGDDNKLIELSNIYCVTQFIREIIIVPSYFLQGYDDIQEEYRDVFNSWIRFRNIHYKLDKPYKPYPTSTAFNYTALKPMFNRLTKDEYGAMQIVFPDGERMTIIKLEKDLSTWMEMSRVTNTSGELKIYLCSILHKETFIELFDNAIEYNWNNKIIHETISNYVSSIEESKVDSKILEYINQPVCWKPCICEHRMGQSIDVIMDYFKNGRKCFNSLMKYFCRDICKICIEY